MHLQVSTYFSNHLGRNNRLGPGSTERSLNPVQRKGWVTPASHEERCLIIMQEFVANALDFVFILIDAINDLTFVKLIS